ncbi:amino acid adenylation domain-containing protein [Rheinheimera baltica]|uniref:Amino acid adenylation domain-containing protein n=1 Tax=Rheinheimera baltica TaxID=67576 RepID=A0ABT9HUF8_9GAMM|nr:non-ribosomal peptide synthetase [Rheinheimera baltica]MDP5134769.1 amino acid adenylation domain-containing protein [Rheinheimera baltica]
MKNPFKRMASFSAEKKIDIASKVKQLSSASSTEQSKKERYTEEKESGESFIEWLTLYQDNDGNPKEALFPLTSSQLRLLYLSQVSDAHSIAYNIPVALLITGDLDVVKLKGCFVKLVERHACLRTCFPVFDGIPSQRVLKQLQPVFIQSVKTHEEVTGYIRKRVKMPFDLENGPLFRVELMNLSNTEHLLLVCFHHIIADGWSVSILIRDLVALFTDDQTLAQVPANVSFQNYSRWQNSSGYKKLTAKNKQYWIDRLTPVPERLSLCFERRMLTKNRTYHGESIDFRIGVDDVAKLSHFAAQNEVTLNMVVLAAFKLLLFQYSGQTDIAVGSPVANRVSSELENVVGLFSNTVIVRSNIKRDARVKDFLAELKCRVLSDYSHQSFPFEEVVEQLNPARSTMFNPIFQYMFVMQNTPRETLHTPDLSWKLVQCETNVSKFDMSLALIETSDGLQGAVEFSTELFEAQHIHRFVEGYKQLLGNIVDMADEKIFSLPTLLRKEQVELAAWNDTHREWGGDGTVLDLFEQQVRLRPDAVALRFANQSTSYRQLNERANKIGHYLLAQGVRPDQRVAVYLDRSPDMVAGILGIAKAGAAYVPLDSGYPVERLAFMLEDSHATCLLSHTQLRRLDFAVDRTLYLDLWDSENVVAHKPLRDFVPQNLAYVIYTSGSTGKPKGVMVSHRSLFNRICWMQKEFDIGPAERIIQKTPLSFDVSVWEVFLPLVTGATMVLLERDKHKDPGYLYEVIQKESVSVCHFVPSMLKSFLHSRTHFSVDSLKMVICSGEELAVQLQNDFHDLINAQLINLYGPTECTVDVSYWYCEPLHNDNVVPIGRPIANSQIYILNQDLNALPPGYVGELYLGGEGLARGYLNWPELTAEKFVVNPFDTGTRLYRTGDKGKFLPDGNVVFIGRVDEQVKVRGLRIELGEIDHHLCQHPALVQAVTIIRDDVYASSEVNQHIVSYIVPQAESQPKLDTLEWKHILSIHLSQFLPSFMLPDFFVVLDEIPLSPSGKAAKTRLPKPRVDSLATSVSVALTCDEVAVAKMWSDLLALAYDKINIEVSFFDLGGHSLLLGKLTSKMNTIFNVSVSISDLFNHSTIKQQAVFIRGLDKVASVELRKNLVSAKGALSMSQQQMLVLHKLFPESPFYNIPFVVEIEGKLNTQALRESLTYLINRHEILRTVYLEDGRGGMRSSVLQDYALPFLFHDFSNESDAHARADELVSKELSAVFDLENLPIVRAVLIKRSDNDHVFALSVHHIGCDGWSLGILAEELSLCYSNIIEGRVEAEALPELPFQFADYAVWESEWAASDAYAKSLDFWKNRLSGAPKTHNLPLDFARKNVTTYTGNFFTCKLPTELYDSVKILAKQKETTVFILIHAAFACLLHRYSGDNDIVVGIPMFSRNGSDVYGIIGCFTNTLPVRIEFAESVTFTQLLEQSKQRLIEAYDNQYVPVETIVNELISDRLLNTNPLFQIMMTSDNYQKGELSIEGASTSLISNHNYTTKTDLSLTLNEHDNEASLTWEYSTELFETISIERLAERFETLLSHCVQDPATLVTNIQLHDGLRIEDYENLQEFSVGDCPTVIHQFERIVKEHSENIALVGEKEVYTYRELDQKAKQLAGYLRSIGVGTEDIVGIHLERSPALVVAVMAVWKAGAAFMPIDITCPDDRVRYMVDNSGVSTIITDRHTRQLDYHREVTRVDVTHSPTFSNFPADGGGSGIEQQHLACVMYTSGSTGRPKGVMIEHRQLRTMQASDLALFEIDQNDRVLQFSNTSFDIFLEELIVSIGGGAPLILRDDDVLDAAEQFWAFIKRHSITVVSLPTYFWHLLCKNIDRVRFDEQTSLRLVVIGGETASSSMWRLWHAKMGNLVRVLNSYGPTETTCFSTYFDLIDFVGERGFIPIGKPRADTSCYILDKNDNLCPPGVTGELVIGGCGVTRGYINSDDNLHRFVRSPFPSQKHTILYKTGDMARMMGDGNIEFIGRCDHQIKVKGYRVDLSEVESLMLTIPQVDAAVSVVSRNAQGDNVIVAYYALNANVQGDSLDVSELNRQIRCELEQKLPYFMQPDFYVAVSHIPLTTSGKVDREKLPQPSESDEISKEPFISDTEKIIAKAWASLIDLDYAHLDRNSNFFHIGGTSLKAVRAVRLINEAFNLDLNIRYIFQYSKLKWLAEVIDLLRQRDEMRGTGSRGDETDLEEMEI